MERKRPAKKGKKGVSRSDYHNLALLSKVLGGILLMVSITFTLRFGVYGLFGVAAGLLFVILGVGLNRYRMWAWYLGIMLLVPLFLLFGTLGLVLIGGGEVSLTSIALILAAVYVSRVLLSKGGRKRYIKLAEARRFAEENPDMAPGRRRRQRAMSEKKESDPSIEDREGDNAG